MFYTRNDDPTTNKKVAEYQIQIWANEVNIRVRGLLPIRNQQHFTAELEYRS